MFVSGDSITGYVCYFTPDGRVAVDKVQNEYSNSNIEGGKLYHVILHTYEKVSSHQADSGYQFTIFFDNCFTYPKTLSKLRGLGVGMTGTSRNRRGCPPPNLVVLKDALYNDVYFFVDPFNNVVVKWIINSIVLIITTSHSPIDFIERVRRRPRLTETNKRHEGCLG